VSRERRRYGFRGGPFLGMGEPRVTGVTTVKKLDKTQKKKAHNTELIGEKIDRVPAHRG